MEDELKECWWCGEPAEKLTRVRRGRYFPRNAVYYRGPLWECQRCKPVQYDMEAICSKWRANP